MVVAAAEKKEKKEKKDKEKEKDKEKNKDKDKDKKEAKKEKKDKKEKDKAKGAAAAKPQSGPAATQPAQEAKPAVPEVNEDFGEALVSDQAEDDFWQDLFADAPADDAEDAVSGTASAAQTEAQPGGHEPQSEVAAAIESAGADSDLMLPIAAEPPRAATQDDSMQAGDVVMATFGGGHAWQEATVVSAGFNMARVRWTHNGAEADIPRRSIRSKDPNLDAEVKQDLPRAASESATETVSAEPPAAPAAQEEESDDEWGDWGTSSSPAKSTSSTAPVEGPKQMALHIGDVVKANFDGRGWFEATILKVGAHVARVKWAYDSSESDVARKNILSKDATPEEEEERAAGMRPGDGAQGGANGLQRYSGVLKSRGRDAGSISCPQLNKDVYVPGHALGSLLVGTAVTFRTNGNDSWLQAIDVWPDEAASGGPAFSPNRRNQPRPPAMRPPSFGEEYPPVAKRPRLGKPAPPVMPPALVLPTQYPPPRSGRPVPPPFRGPSPGFPLAFAQPGEVPPPRLSHRPQPPQHPPPPQVQAMYGGMNQPAGSEPEKGTSTNPAEVLQRLALQPRTMQQWANIQDEVWAGHPPLPNPQDWIRVWSRTKEREYYVNIYTMLSTFNREEAT